MCHGQTNGIPQGSTLMDFIAEIILGYVDLSLTKEIEKTEIINYKIIRYRDDYRIFTHSPHEAEHIAKLLTECLLNMGMSLNNQKTGMSSNIIQSSIKPDKLFWINQKRSNKSLQEHLILIHQLSIKYPNSGTLKKALHKFHLRLEIESKKSEVSDYRVLISIVVDIMVKNPSTYSTTTALLSELFTFCTLPAECEEILNLILFKFKNIPNTGHLEVWLQRLTIKYDRFFEYVEPITKKVNDSSLILWNSGWLSPTLCKVIDSYPIINENSIENISHIITSEEIRIFKTSYDNGY